MDSVAHELDLCFCVWPRLPPIFHVDIVCFENRFKWVYFTLPSGHLPNTFYFISPSICFISPTNLLHFPNKLLRFPNKLIRFPNKMLHFPNQILISPMQCCVTLLKTSFGLKSVSSDPAHLMAPLPPSLHPLYIYEYKISGNTLSQNLLTENEMYSSPFDSSSDTRYAASRDLDSSSLKVSPTYRLTWVGTRITCVSKKIASQDSE